MRNNYKHVSVFVLQIYGQLNGPLSVSDVSRSQLPVKILYWSDPNCHKQNGHLSAKTESFQISGLSNFHMIIELSLNLKSLIMSWHMLSEILD